MADHSAIEWCDSTFNPWIGCTKVSPACDHCYAAVSTPARTLGIAWGTGQPRRRTSIANWKLPLRWQRQDFRQCGACGWRGVVDTMTSDCCPDCGCHESLDPTRRRVFCASLADVFDNGVDPTWRRDLFELIRATPNLDWLLLTKRIGNVRSLLEQQQKQCARYELEYRFFMDWLDGRPPANVWLGATICNQAEADRDIPKLLGSPAAVRWLSCEPLLGPVGLWPTAFLPCPSSEGMVMDPTTGAYECCKECDFTGVGDESGIDWVIAGGESGPGARPMHPDWARSLRDQCASAGVPFFFKQWGKWGQYVNEDHYTHCGEERHPHAWVDSKSADHGLCWVIDDDGNWSNQTGEPPMDVTDRIAVMGNFGKKAAGSLLDCVKHNAYPETVE